MPRSGGSVRCDVPKPGERFEKYVEPLCRWNRIVVALRTTPLQTLTFGASVVNSHFVALRFVMDDTSAAWKQATVYYGGNATVLGIYSYDTTINQNIGDDSFIIGSTDNTFVFTGESIVYISIEPDAYLDMNLFTVSEETGTVFYSLGSIVEYSDVASLTADLSSPPSTAGSSPPLALASPPPSPPPAECLDPNVEVTGISGVYYLNGDSNPVSVGGNTYTFEIPSSHPLRIFGNDTDCVTWSPLPSGTTVTKSGHYYYKGAWSVTFSSACDSSQSLWCYWHGSMNGAERILWNPSCVFSPPPSASPSPPPSASPSPPPSARRRLHRRPRRRRLRLRNRRRPHQPRLCRPHRRRRPRPRRPRRRLHRRPRRRRLRLRNRRRPHQPRLCRPHRRRAPSPPSPAPTPPPSASPSPPPFGVAIASAISGAIPRSARRHWNHRRRPHRQRHHLRRSVHTL